MFNMGDGAAVHPMVNAFFIENHFQNNKNNGITLSLFLYQHTLHGSITPFKCHINSSKNEISLQGIEASMTATYL